MPAILQNIEMYVLIELLNNKKDICNTFYKNGKEHTKSRSIGFNDFTIPSSYINTSITVNVKVLTYTIDNSIITNEQFHIVSEYIKQVSSAKILGENIQCSKEAINIHKKIPNILPLIRLVIDILDKALFEARIKLGTSVEVNEKTVIPKNDYYDHMFWPLTYKIRCYELELTKLYEFMKSINSIKDINYKDIVVQTLQSHNSNYDILCKFIKDSIQNLESLNGIKHVQKHSTTMINAFISELLKMEKVIREMEGICDEYDIGYEKKIFDTIEYIDENKNYVYIDAEELICPITLDYIKDPVLLSDGHIYEKEAIQLWLQKNSISPKTNTLLVDKKITNVHLLKNVVKNIVS